MGAHDGAVTTSEFDRDGKRVVTASQDGTARVWNADTGEPITPWLRHEGGVDGDISPDGGWVLTASADGSVRLWDAQSGARVRAYSEETNAATCAVFGLRGSRVVAGYQDGSVRLWETETGRLLAAPAHLALVFPIQASPDGRWFAT